MYIYTGACRDKLLNVPSLKLTENVVTQYQTETGSSAWRKQFRAVLSLLVNTVSAHNSENAQTF
jgi:hypothetical protein